MLSQVIEKIYDNRRSDSLASDLRRKRFALFNSLIKSTRTPLKILDVGGRPSFWENTGLFNQESLELEITLLNIEQINHPKFKCVVGDARKMYQFKDLEFDIVFSNSVIEHVGDYNEQLQMANEVKRVGKKYFIQTPNLYFPIEPHFVFPFFQFLPIVVRVWLLTHFNLGWRKKTPDKQQALSSVTSIKLLSKQKLMNLFPEGKLYEEKFGYLTKSFIVYGGW
ncbi:methyltransferase domain-containing protein [Chlorogloeopsis sp. ULAP02]|uniref:methyltransferase domain-containing protein n=1 Tax=Chlorogloeopsis sp. ULAP02 TaxID=3107926 RepID=UPI0031375186